MDPDPAATVGFPERGPLMQIGNRDEGLSVKLSAGPTAEIIVHHGHFMATTREVHGGGPT
jgi:hypothetical protein